MVANLSLAALMVATTTLIHYMGFIILLRALGAHAHRLRADERMMGRAALILVVVLSLMAIHSIEIWLYAIAYRTLGMLPDFETAIYFSTTTFATIGYGDVVIDPTWRLFASVEGANGLLLFGWSTAFLTSVILRLLEYDWLTQNGNKG